MKHTKAERMGSQLSMERGSRGSCLGPQRKDRIHQMYISRLLDPDAAMVNDPVLCMCPVIH